MHKLLVQRKLNGSSTIRASTRPGQGGGLLDKPTAEKPISDTENKVALM